MIKRPRMDHRLWYFKFRTMLICLKNQATFVSFFPNEAELKTHITYYPGYWSGMCFKLQIVVVDLEIIDTFICRVVLLFSSSSKHPQNNNKLKALCFCLTWSHMICVVEFPIVCCPMFEIAFLPFGMGMFWPRSHCFIALVTGFHTIFHTHFVPWLFTKVSLPSRTVPRRDGWHFQWKSPIVGS